MDSAINIFPIFYLGSLEYFHYLLKMENVIFEKNENFIKQTYRNRCSIYGANGKLNLIIPLNKTGERRLIKDITISTESRWQNLHWRSFQSAYRSSPYFEYYEDELVLFYEKKYKFLLDFNIEIQNKIVELLKTDLPVKFTTSYQTMNNENDFRTKFDEKKESSLISFEEKKYIQVFSDKHGFIKNLSIVDLLFNEGPNSINYLKSLT